MDEDIVLDNVLFLLNYIKNYTVDINDRYSLMVTFYEGIENTVRRYNKESNCETMAVLNCIKDIEVDSVEKFLNLVYDWLNRDSQELKNILLQRAYSTGYQNNIQMVNSFFTNT